jgi:hypothetical protein
MYFDGSKVMNVDNSKSASNSTNDPMFDPEDGVQIKNSAVQNKTQQGYRKFPYSLLPLSVVASNSSATSYMSDSKDDEKPTKGKSKVKKMVEDIVDKKFPKEVLDKIKKYGDINKNGIPDIDIISDENPLLVRKVTTLIDIIEKNQATGEQKGVILNYLINNIGTIDIPVEYKNEMLKKLR